MGKPYSEDLRARVVRAEQDGATIPETAEQLGVSISSVVRFLRLHPETSVSTTIARLSRWAPQGERLVQKLPHGNWKTITFIAALRHDRVTAPFVLEGPMTGEMFKAYTQQFLAPTLKRGDIVFMDNVSVHKVDGIEDAINARGAIPFYLPAYSPDLNPIEQLFAKLKALLRKIAAYTLL